MTREEKLKRKAVGYGLAIRDIMVMHGAKKESAEAISQAIQIAYLAGAAEADANPINPWNARKEKKHLQEIQNVPVDEEKLRNDRRNTV